MVLLWFFRFLWALQTAIRLYCSLHSFPLPAVRLHCLPLVRIAIRLYCRLAPPCYEMAARPMELSDWLALRLHIVSIDAQHSDWAMEFCNGVLPVKSRLPCDAVLRNRALAILEQWQLCMAV